MILLSNEDFRAIKRKAKLNETLINHETVYEKNGLYYRITLVNDLGGYVIECAETLEEAKKNFFEDLDIVDNNVARRELIDRIINCINSAS